MAKFFQIYFRNIVKKEIDYDFIEIIVFVMPAATV